MSEFVECATCAAKPGSPLLCASCIANRTIVNKLRGDLKVAHAERDEWIARFDEFRAGSRALNASLRTEVSALQVALRQALALADSAYEDQRCSGDPLENPHTAELWKVLG